MHVILPQTFAPPMQQQTARRVLGVVLALVTVLPTFVLNHLQVVPHDEGKLNFFGAQTPVYVLGLILPGLAAWLMALCYVGAERLRYEVADGQLTVHAMLRSYTLPLRGARVTQSTDKLTLRLAGTGLPGFFTGFFLLGSTRVRVWATRRDGGVVVDGAKRWFLTPDDVPGFLAAARAAGATVA